MRQIKHNDESVRLDWNYNLKIKMSLLAKALRGEPQILLHSRTFWAKNCTVCRCSAGLFVFGGNVNFFKAVDWVWSLVGWTPVKTG